ncbi:unnamed protein product [Prunus armeniaca]|uniref:Uncharacterized protein n=1 Tax=Prunus armeniaca TaxID=36596 RepID=A0A6J5W146_PRUAR|nr:unnamed protein product [Prunus armeniaca]
MVSDARTSTFLCSNHNIPLHFLYSHGDHLFSSFQRLYFQHLLRRHGIQPQTLSSHCVFLSSTACPVVVHPQMLILRIQVLHRHRPPSLIVVPLGTSMLLLPPSFRLMNIFHPLPTRLITITLLSIIPCCLKMTLVFLTLGLPSTTSSQTSLDSLGSRSAIVPGPALVIQVWGVDIPLIDDSIVAAFGLTSHCSPESNPFVLANVERHTLMHLLYIDPSPEPPSELHSATILYSLQFGFFIPFERFLHESLIAAGSINASCPSSSLVLPRIITSLAKFHGIPSQPTDDIGCSNMIKLNVQHHETMTLLRTFQDTLANQSDMIAVMETHLGSNEAHLWAPPSG